MVKYLSIDTETGGIGLDKSLLSIGLVLADVNLKPICTSHFMCKPNDGVYHTDAQGLEINGINLVEHNKIASTYKKIGTSLYSILEAWSDNGKDKLIVVGKQVYGDLLQVWDKIIGRTTWETFVSYRHLDVTSVFMFMRMLGVYPLNMNGSLSELLEYHKIPPGTLHDALSDARQTLLLLEAMYNEMSKM